MKNMKKKVVIIATMVLLLAAVLVMSISTFAKYASTSEVTTKNATVAKWGLVLTTTATDLFPDTYGAATDGLADVWATGEGVSVQAFGAATAVVAPGTTGSMTFSVTGTSDVLAKLTISTADSTDLILKHKVDENDEQTYAPIVWTLKKGSTEMIAQSTSLASVANTFNASARVIEPSASISEEYTLSWAWAFDNSAATTITADGTAGGTALTGNEADTILGKLANGDTVDNYTKQDLSLSFSFTVEQIQAAS